MSQVELIFDCPYCHEPFSSVVGNEVDIQASCECAGCHELVTFQVFDEDEYVAYCEWFRTQHERQ